MEQNLQGQNPQKSGWSWMGFLFGIFYYAGYGKLKKAIIMGLPIAIPIIGIIVSLVIAIYCGINARRDLPIKKVPFGWSNVGIVLLIVVGLYALIGVLIGLLS